jgi:hypothetical protein
VFENLDCPFKFNDGALKRWFDAMAMYLLSFYEIGFG